MSHVALRSGSLLSRLRVCGPGSRRGAVRDDLLKHTPPNTNTIVLIDVKGALASPLAKLEKLAKANPGTIVEKQAKDLLEKLTAGEHASK